MSDPQIDQDAATKALLAIHPHGFTVSKDGTVTSASAVSITSLAQLAGLAQATKEFQFDVHGQTVRVTIRPLLDSEIADIEKIGSEVMPPPRYSDREKKIVSGYDRLDPDYQKKMARVYELRRAAKLALAIPALEIPKGSAEQQLEHITKNLPTHIIDALYAAVLSLCSDPIERAAFI